VVAEKVVVPPEKRPTDLPVLASVITTGTSGIGRV
jgi:hypothetical protein